MRVYAPERLGKVSILLAAVKVLKIGTISKSSFDPLGLPYTVSDGNLNFKEGFLKGSNRHIELKGSKLGS
ncbi:MAG: hypothetical protein ABIO36_08740 [Pyrinomonadaceae bacterium]